MGTYNLKTPVRAEQWNGDEKKLLPGMDYWMPRRHECQPGYFIKIDGVRVPVRPTDWIVQLPNDELRVFTDEDFQGTYVEDASVTEPAIEVIDPLADEPEPVVKAPAKKRK